MRIAFLDFGNAEYDPSTVDSAPIGGTESAASYLSRSLARQGHEVFLLSRKAVVGTVEGVMCLPRERAPLPSTLNLDAMICIGAPSNPAGLRSMLGPSPRLIRWIHLPHDHPPVQSLKNVSEQLSYNALALVSNWQRDQFHQRLGVDPSRVGVMRNAIGYPFENQFPPDQPILAAKQWPPVLAYCSAPYRGLAVLLEAFPRIREAVPGTRLKVVTGLKLYGMPAQTDEATFGPLYQRCRETEGVELLEPMPQPQLARQMRDVSILTYPNTFAETSCIVAMEAMASGARVVTTEHGALPETTAPFGYAVRLRPTLAEFLQAYVAQVVELLREQSGKPEETEAFLRRQVDHMNQTATWDLRAKEWVDWLKTL
jgi:glycosyltransferase involved in cell wall biosynthesis